MPHETKCPDIECDHSLLADNDYPTLCGTMLLYAGKIQLIPEDHNREPLDDEAKGPTFL